MLKNIIPSQTRRKIMSLFFTNVGSVYHLRKVGREVEEEINAVKRELDILEKAGVLRKERRINKVIYSLNPKYIFYDEFLRIFAKESGLVTDLLKNLPKLGKVKFATLSTKLATRTKISEGEIYLLFVGVIVIPEVVSIVSAAEKLFGSEINYTVMTEEEFSFRKKNNDPFIWKFLRYSRIMIVGEEEDLLA